MNIDCFFCNHLQFFVTLKDVKNMAIINKCTAHYWKNILFIKGTWINSKQSNIKIKRQKITNQSFTPLQFIKSLIFMDDFNQSITLPSSLTILSMGTLINHFV